jgi:hypothetical protein
LRKLLCSLLLPSISWVKILTSVLSSHTSFLRVLSQDESPSFTPITKLRNRAKHDVPYTNSGRGCGAFKILKLTGERATA